MLFKIYKLMNLFKLFKIYKPIKIAGNELMKDGFYQEAINSYSEAIRLDPNNPVYYSNRQELNFSINYNKSMIFEESNFDCSISSVCKDL